jgi:hypothetical protein
MSFSLHHFRSYQTRKKKLIIPGSKCFFLIQWYNASPEEIEQLAAETASLGLRLTRFPVSNWRKIAPPYLTAAKNVPAELSNYILLGQNKLSPEELAVWSNIIARNNIAYLGGRQGNIWFNIQRLRESQILKAPTSEASLEIFQLTCQNVPPFSVTQLIFYFLLTTLEFRHHWLK